MFRPFLLLFCFALISSCWLLPTDNSEKNLREIAQYSTDGFRPNYVQDFQILSLQQSIDLNPQINVEEKKELLSKLLNQVAICINSEPCELGCCPRGPCEPDGNCPTGMKWLFSIDEKIKLTKVRVKKIPSDLEFDIPLKNIDGTETGVELLWDSVEVSHDDRVNITFNLSNNEQFSFIRN